MSLIKAKNLKVTKRESYDSLRASFLEIIDTIYEDKPTRSDIIVLLNYYTTYSINYLIDVAETLVEPKDIQQTMKFMNSYIAEYYRLADLHYFHKEGYTIIDKCIQNALDNDGVLLYETVDKEISAIEESHKEDEVVEEA